MIFTKQLTSLYERLIVVSIFETEGVNVTNTPLGWLKLILIFLDDPSLNKSRRAVMKIPG